MQEKRNLETLRAAVVFSFLSVAIISRQGRFFFDYHFYYLKVGSRYTKKNHVLKKVRCGGSVLFYVPFSGQ